MAKYKIGDFVVHGREVGKITDIRKDFRGMGDCYRIQSLSDETLYVTTPVSTEDTALRAVISKAEAKKLIGEMLDINTVEVEQRNAEAVYNGLIKSGDHRDMVKLIKTSYEKCEDKMSKGLQRNEKDKMFLRLGERLLYSELAIALGMTFDEAKAHVISHLHALEKVA